MLYTGENRGKIQFRDRKQQIMDFSGMRYSNVTPTDVDMFFEKTDKAFVFAEIKYGNAKMPDGQKKAMTRLIDALQDSGREAVFFLCRHFVSDTAEDVDVSKSTVVSIYYKREWLEQSQLNTLRESCNDFLRKALNGNIFIEEDYPLN